jgi:predicted aldo/keto reductase-like oxidoreductase
MGAALADGGYRNKVYLMAKIDSRNKENGADQINNSMTRLKTDRIDLLRFQEILRSSCQLWAMGVLANDLVKKQRDGAVI